MRRIPNSFIPIVKHVRSKKIVKKFISKKFSGRLSRSAGTVPAPVAGIFLKSRKIAGRREELEEGVNSVVSRTEHQRSSKKSQSGQSYGQNTIPY